MHWRHGWCWEMRFILKSSTKVLANRSPCLGSWGYFFFFFFFEPQLLPSTAGASSEWRCYQRQYICIAVSGKYWYTQQQYPLVVLSGKQPLKAKIIDFHGFYLCLKKVSHKSLLSISRTKKKKHGSYSEKLRLVEKAGKYDNKNFLLCCCCIYTS